MFKTPSSSSKSIPKLSISKEDYHIGPLLGEGGLGFVFRATETKTKNQVALKAMKK